MVSQQIAKIKIQREPGFLYYVKSDSEGWLCIYKTEMRTGGTKKEDRKSAKKLKINEQPNL
jgi:hypothetical protein